MLQHVKNWYEIITDVKNWYLLLTDVNARIYNTCIWSHVTDSIHHMTSVGHNVFLLAMANNVSYKNGNHRFIIEHKLIISDFSIRKKK